MEQKKIIAETVDLLDKSEDRKLNESAVNEDEVQTNIESLKLFANPPADDAHKDIKKDAFNKAVTEIAKQYEGVSRQLILSWIFNDELSSLTANLGNYHFEDIRSDSEDAHEKTRFIQTALNFMGYDFVVDGFYGSEKSETRRAVKDVQQFLLKNHFYDNDDGRNVDGLFGEKTLKALKKFLTSPMAKVLNNSSQEADAEDEEPFSVDGKNEAEDGHQEDSDSKQKEASSTRLRDDNSEQEELKSISEEGDNAKQDGPSSISAKGDDTRADGKSASSPAIEHSPPFMQSEKTVHQQKQLLDETVLEFKKAKNEEEKKKAISKVQILLYAELQDFKKELDGDKNIDQTTREVLTLEICYRQMNKDFAKFIQTDLKLYDEQEGKNIMIRCLKGRKDFFANSPCPLDIINNFRLLESLSYAKDLLLITAEQDPDNILKHVSNYQHAPFVKEVLKTAVYSSNDNLDELKKMVSSQFFDVITSAVQERNQAIDQIKAIIANEKKANFKELLKDPALKVTDYLKIQDSWLSNLLIVDMSGPELKVALLRNLYFQKKEVNEKNVHEECQKISEAREKSRNISLFADRNVLFAAHCETVDDWNKQETEKGNILDVFVSSIILSSNYSSDRNFFGRDTTMSAIREQQKIRGSLDPIRPEKTSEKLKKAKEDTLEKITNTTPPFTFVFDGHGSPDALYFSDGEPKQDGSFIQDSNTIKITVEEFSHALKARYQKFPYLSGPIMTSVAEYGQYGIGNIDSSFGDYFFEKTLDLKQKGKKTVHDIVQNSNLDDTNTTLFAPTDLEIDKCDIFLFTSCFSHDFIRNVQKNVGFTLRQIA